MIDPQALLAHPALEVPYAYGPRDVMLHALGCGMGTDPMDPVQLRYVYDAPRQPLLALPTLPIVLGWVDLVRDPRSRDPRLGIDPDQIVVGQAVLTLLRMPGTEGRGTARTFYHAVVDKGAGRGALVCVRREVRAADAVLLATVDTWLFARGDGGFGGPRDGAPARHPTPERPPDMTVVQPTPANLALTYRLSLGDHNAVHADPAHAQRTGFARPILHGLATFSMALHGAVRAATGDLIAHAPCLRQAGATLTRPVFPGDTLHTDVWREEGAIVFRTRAPERAVEVVGAGRIELAATPSALHDAGPH